MKSSRPMRHLALVESAALAPAKYHGRDPGRYSARSVLTRPRATGTLRGTSESTSARWLGRHGGTGGSVMDERRRHARTNVSWPVRLWVDEGSLVGRTEDTSEGGICVAIAPTASVKLGSSYRVDVLASHMGPFSVIGEARHVDNLKVGFETDRLLPLVE